MWKVWLLVACGTFLEFQLIPFGIALIWYNSNDLENIPYDSPPAGGQNILPCLVEVRAGTNGFFILNFHCKREILITVRINS